MELILHFQCLSAISLCTRYALRTGVEDETFIRLVVDVHIALLEFAMDDTQYNSPASSLKNSKETRNDFICNLLNNTIQVKPWPVQYPFQPTHAQK